MSDHLIQLSKAERAELKRRAQGRRGGTNEARIARVLLLLADGATYREVAVKVGCSDPFISKWKQRFLADRLGGLYARHSGRPKTVLTPRLEAQILNWTRRPPSDGSARWSTRRLARKLCIHHMMVARVWQVHGLAQRSGLLRVRQA